MSNLRDKMSQSLFWRGIEKFLVNGSQFIISLVLARLLLPSDYGTIALLTIFISLSQVLIEGGFSQVIIQKQKTDALDFSTMFCCNLFTSLFLYVVIYFIAPSISDFYNQPDLLIVMRVYCITLVINSLYIVRKTQFIMALRFKEQAYITFISVIISGLIGICLAFKNYGVWSLVYQQLCNALILCLLFNRLNISVYSLNFSKNRFLNLFGKGSKLLIANVFQSIYSSLYSLIIGKYFSTRELGLFTRGNQMGQIIPSNVTDVFSNTVYPIFCQECLNANFSKIYIKYVSLICFVFFPCMVLISVISYPLIELLLGTNWVDCAIYMKIVCIAYAFDPLMRLNAQVPTIMGRTDTTLKCELTKKIVAVAILFVAVAQSVLMVCYGIVLYALIDVAISTRFNEKYIGITIKEIFLSIKNALFVSLLQYAIVSFVIDKILNSLFAIFVAVMLSFLIVWITAYVFRFKELNILIGLVTSWKHKKILK